MLQIHRAKRNYKSTRLSWCSQFSNEMKIEDETKKSGGGHSDVQTTTTTTINI
jgi:hypothetical protein